LAAAKQRGVVVRVLVDRDRPSDAYGSTDINRSAVEALTEAGVEVRWDSISQLAHSKVVVVDSSTTLIGSHNWTEKSFFEYQEVSVLIESGSLARHYEEVFEERFSGGLTR
jgi:phosphatidylserine/phosphatidylglycerophosphate/cardiolipin synthase-like enzyme